MRKVLLALDAGKAVVNGAKVPVLLARWRGAVSDG